jgi:hypothetical protein
MRWRSKRWRCTVKLSASFHIPCWPTANAVAADNELAKTADDSLTEVGFLVEAVNDAAGHWGHGPGRGQPMAAGLRSRRPAGDMSCRAGAKAELW